MILYKVKQYWGDERFFLSAALLFQQATVFLLLILLAGTLGAADYGSYALVKTIVTAGGTFATLGLNISLLRILTEFDNSPADRISVFRTFRLIAGASGFAIAGVFFFLSAVLNVFPNQAYGFWIALAIGLIGVPLSADISLFGAYFRVTGHVRTFASISIFFFSSINLILSVAAVFYSRSYVAVVTANTIAVASVVLALGWRLRAERLTLRPAPSQSQALGYDYPKAIVISLWMAGATFAFILMRSLDIVILGRFSPSAAVGSYSLLSAVAYVVFIVPLALSQTLGPDVARAYEGGGKDQIKARFGVYFREAGTISAFLAAGIAAFGDQLGLFVGSSFNLVPGTVFALALSQLISALFSPTGYALSMTGYHREEFWLLALATLVLAAGLYAAVPAYGAEGAALVSLAVYAGANGARYMLVRFYLGMWMMSWHDLLPVLVAFALAYSVRILLGLTEINAFAMVTGCLIYTAVFWLFFGRVLSRFSGRVS